MTAEEFLKFAEPLPEPMVLLFGDGPIIAANQAFCRLINSSATQIQQRCLADFVQEPPEEVCHYLQQCSRSREVIPGALTPITELAGPFECRAQGAAIVPRSDNAPAVILIRLIAKESAVGRFVALNQRIDQLNQEIRRRRQTEAALYQSNEKFRAIVAQAATGVVQVDLTGKFIFVNDRFCAITGYSRDELLNFSAGDITHPDDWPENFKLLSSAASGGPNYAVEKRYIRKDGSIVPVDISVSAISNPAGQVESIVAVVLDITERKRDEKLLVEQKKLLELVASGQPRKQCIDALLEAVARVSRNVRAGVLLANEQRTAIGDSFTPHFPPTFAEGVAGVPINDLLIGTCVAAIHTGQAITCDDVAHSGHWSPQWRQLCLAHGIRACHSVPVFGPDGKPKASFVLCFSEARAPTDWELRIAEFGAHIASIILERDRMTQSLRDADRRKDEFLATLAHELRNPLSPIMNSLEIMKRAMKRPRVLNRARQVMQRQVLHMVRLVDDLLDVSRIARDKLELRNQKVELTSILRDALETIRPMADRFEHNFRINLPDEPIYLEADPGRLAQIFGNLLNNACKYTPPGGRIELSAQRRGSQAIVKIADTGVGIPADMLPRIFDMFTQVDRSLERSQGGLGIGLTLVKRLVEMHGGSVSAKSDGEGRGSEFVIRLPAIIQPLEIQPDPEETPAVTISRGRRILVVDDNSDSAKTLARLLKFVGNQTQTARDGDEALAKAAAYQGNRLCDNLTW